MKRLFCCLTLWLICGMGWLSAERTVRVLYYGAPKKSELKHAYLYGCSEDPVRVILNRSNFSSQIEISNETKVIRVLPEVVNGDEEFPKNAPVVTIPANWEDTLLIFFHNPNNKLLPIRIQKINASEGVFNPGEFYWINMSDVLVGGLVGKQKLRILPKQTAVMKSPGGKVECEVKLDFKIQGEKKSRALIRQMWRVDEKTRQVVFILKKPAPEMASYYVLPLRDPEPKKQK